VAKSLWKAAADVHSMVKIVARNWIVTRTIARSFSKDPALRSASARSTAAVVTCAMEPKYQCSAPS